MVFLSKIIALNSLFLNCPQVLPFVIGVSTSTAICYFTSQKLNERGDLLRSYIVPSDVTTSKYDNKVVK